MNFNSKIDKDKSISITDKIDTNKDIVDYKKLLNEKNEYIKLLFSENNSLKDKVTIICLKIVEKNNS